MTQCRISLQGLVGKFMRDEIYIVIHKAAGLPAAAQNGLWRPFVLVAPIHNQWDIFQWSSGMVPGKVRKLWGQCLCKTIHKAAGLMVPGCSMTLPGTIPENLLSPPAECWTVALWITLLWIALLTHVRIDWTSNKSVITFQFSNIQSGIAWIESHLA